MQQLPNIRSVAIFFDASSEDCRKEAKSVIKKLSSEHIKVQALGFFNSKKPDMDFISDHNLYFATLKDFSFFFLPKSEEVKEFTNATPDMFFVYASTHTFPAQAVIELSRASLKIGFSGLWNHALDLTFEINSLNPKDLTKQVEQYLKNGQITVRG